MTLITLAPPKGELIFILFGWQLIYCFRIWFYNRFISRKHLFVKFLARPFLGMGWEALRLFWKSWYFLNERIISVKMSEVVRSGQGRGDFEKLDYIENKWKDSAGLPIQIAYRLFRILVSWTRYKGELFNKQFF